MSDQAKVNEEKVLNETDGFSEKEKAANRPGTEKRDWVAETVQAFIKDAQSIDPTDPVKAIEAYFAKNATDELKAKCKAEGKDAALCWKFIVAVAREALGGRNGHIDPGVVYAIAMHYFEDVPLNWDGPTTGKVAHTPRASAKVEKAKKAKKAKRPEIPKSAQPKPETPKPETPKPETLPPGTKPKKAKPRFEQGFLFEMLETQPESEVAK